MEHLDISLAKAQAYLEQLDLHYIVEAMCAETYPLPRWVKEDALHCLKLYKNFLLLQKKHLPYSLVPTREIDEFWHNHILYTQRYTHDCLHIFGHYLHHRPTMPEDDPKELVDHYLKTKQFYLEEFGEPLHIL